MKKRLLAILLSVSMAAANMLDFAVTQAEETTVMERQEKEISEPEKQEEEISEPEKQEEEINKPEKQENTEEKTGEEQGVEVKEETEEKQKIMTVAANETYGDFTYSVSGKEATITKYTGNSTSVAIPEKIGEYTVTGIGSSAFSGCETLKEVVLTENVKTISDYAFRDCSALGRLVLPESVESLGYQMIVGTEISSIKVPKSVKSCGHIYGYGGPFAGAEELTEVTIEEGMEKIPDYLLYRAGSVETVSIPDSVESIGNYAFEDCTGLKSISLPGKLSTIGYYAFSGCTALGDVEFPAGVSSVGSRAFSGCTSIGKVMFTENEKKSFKVEIGNSAFSGCETLNEVVLTKNIETIEGYAFKGCSALGRLVLPENVENLGYRIIEGTEISSIKVPKSVKKCEPYDAGILYGGPFAGAEELTEVTIEEEMEKIPDYLLCRAGSVETVSIPDSVESIGNYAFEDCTGLKSISLPGKLSTIGYYAFSGCTALGDVEFPAGVSSVGSRAFSGCTSIGKVMFTENEKKSFKVEIGNSAFSGCETLNEVVLTKNIETIEGYAFKGCSALGRLVLPENVENLGYRIIEGTEISSIKVPKSVKKCEPYDAGILYGGPFAGAEELTEVIIEEGMEKIPDYLLYRASSVKKVVIPSSVVSVGNYAFDGCTGFTIYGYKNSYAETYADENDIPFYSVAISKSATPEEILKIANVGNLLGNISLGNGQIIGPTITIADKDYTLFTLDTNVSLKLSDKVQAKVDPVNKTVQILIGFKNFEGSASIGGEGNKTTYWSESYQQVKSLYTGMTGKEVDTAQLWNRFSHLRGRLKSFEKENDCNLMMKVNGKKYFAGYIELSYASGELVLSEGGLVAEVSMGTSFDYTIPAFPAAYLTFGIEGDVNGKLQFVRQEQRYLPQGSLGANLAANIGVGLGEKKIGTYVEGGLKGWLDIGLKFPEESMWKALSVILGGEVYFDSKIIGFSGPSYHHEFGEGLQLYPTTRASSLSLSELTVDTDTAEPIGRSYLLDKKPQWRTLALQTEFKKEGLYPYNQPQLRELSGGKKILIWIDDNPGKSDINRTSLMYSVYDGKSWSAEKMIAETGSLNDYPFVYQESDKIFVLWQKASRAFGKEETLTNVLKNMDLYLAVYENGAFSEAEKVTGDNQIYEMLQSMAVSGDKKAAAWVENSENDVFMSEGTTSIKLKKYENGAWKEETVLSGKQSVYNLCLDYIQGKPVLAYEVESGEGTAVYLYQDGNTKELSSAKEMGNIQILDGSLYYLSSGSLCVYDLAKGTDTDLGLSGLGDYTVEKEGENLAVLTTEYTGFTSELAAYLYNGKASAWSEEIVLTQEERYIRNYSAAFGEDGHLYAALNTAEVYEKLTDGSMYGTAELSVRDLSAQTDLAVGTALSYDDRAVKPGEELSLAYTVKNQGLEEISSFDVALYDSKNMVLKTETVNCRLEPGETKEVTYSYKLPNPLLYHEVRLEVKGKGEINVKDNSVSTGIGYADIAVDTLSLEGSGTTAKVKAIVANVGYDSAEEVNLNLYMQKEEKELLQTINIGTVKRGETKELELELPETCFNVELLALGNEIFAEAECSSTENRWDNNSRKLFISSVAEGTIQLNALEMELSKGEQKELYVSYATESTLKDSPVTWTSSDSNLVSVDSKGKVTAVAEGTATVTAAVNGKEASCRVTVISVDNSDHDNEEEIPLGDLDQNGSINAADALAVLKIAAKLKEPTSAEETAADVNKDGRVNAADALSILKYAAGLNTEFV